MFRKFLAWMGIIVIMEYGWYMFCGHENFFKAFHKCPCCGKYRYDDVTDWLSQAEHIRCGACGHERPVRTSVALSFFSHQTNRTLRERAKMSRIKWFSMSTQKKYEKHFPNNRGGATAAELESKEFFERILYSIQRRRY